VVEVLLAILLEELMEEGGDRKQRNIEHLPEAFEKQEEHHRALTFVAFRFRSLLVPRFFYINDDLLQKPLNRSTQDVAFTLLLSHTKDLAGLPRISRGITYTPTRASTWTARSCLPQSQSAPHGQTARQTTAQTLINATHSTPHPPLQSERGRMMVLSIFLKVRETSLMTSLIALTKRGVQLQSKSYVGP